MVRFKKLAILCISSLIQISLVQSQWSGGFPHYVPYSQSGTSFTTSGTVQYVPVQGVPLGIGPNNPIQNTVQSFDQYPTNGPYPPSNLPIYSDSPTVSYQGLDEANALRSAYPNQPIIIINNGGNGDTGGNSNNGNGGKKDGFNFGDLAAILLATRHRHGQEGSGGDPRPEPASPPVTAPQSVSAPQGVNCNNNIPTNAGSEYGGNNKCSMVTHITIVLPSSGATVSVEQKKKKCKDNDKEKKKIVKEVQEEKKIDSMDVDEEEDLNETCNDE